MARPALSNEASAVGALGKGNAPVQVGAAVQLAQSPQSTAQLVHVSPPVSSQWRSPQGSTEVSSPVPASSVGVGARASSAPCDPVAQPPDATTQEARANHPSADARRMRSGYHSGAVPSTVLAATGPGGWPSQVRLR